MEMRKEDGLEMLLLVGAIQRARAGTEKRLVGTMKENAFFFQNVFSSLLILFCQERGSADLGSLRGNDENIPSTRHLDLPEASLLGVSSFCFFFN